MARWPPRGGLPHPRRTHKPAEPLRLFELPAAWLAQLLQVLPSASLVALMGTSKQLRDLVLTGPYATRDVVLKLALLKVTPLQAASCLRLASKHCPELALEMCATTMSDMDVDLFSHSLNGVLLSCSEHLMNVTKLHLKGAKLDTLLPLRLRQSLPGLKRLRLEECTIDWDACSAASFEGPMPPLQALHVEDCHWQGDGSRNWPALQTQLAQLTSLESLRMKSMYAEHRGVYDVIGRGVLATQLTSLSCSVEPVRDAFGPEPFQSFPAHLSWLDDTPDWAGRLKQHLQHLSLPASPLEAEQLEVISQMAGLTHLHAESVDVEEAGLAVLSRLMPQLRKLTLGWTSTTQLARLPLHDALALEISSKAHVDLVAGDLATMEQAVANVMRCTTFTWNVPEVVLCPEWLGDEDWEQSLLHALPLVASPHASAGHLQLDHLHLKPEAEHVGAALRAALRSSPKLHTLTLGDTCECDIAEVCYLVGCGCLRSGSTLRVFHYSEAMLSRVCCAARAPLTVHVMCSSPLLDEEGPEWEARITAAMKQCGHQHASLSWEHVQQYYDD